MKTEVLNTNINIQKPVQGDLNAPNTIKQTAPTRISFSQNENKISSAASNPIERNSINLIEALKAKAFAQAPVSYSYIRDIKIPYSNNAKLYKLSNGQQVVVLEKKGPTVLQTFYNVGSMNEPDEIRGISHFNEHMAFNGSKGPQGRTLGSGDFFKIVNEMGAMTNASTGFSQTDYFISSQLLGNNVFDRSAFIQSQQLQYPEHTAEMVEKEKGPVTSEISMVGDSPENIAMNNCIRNLFNIQTTSSDLVAGSIKNINNLTKEKTLDYYNLWYTPDNCSTVITGEVPADEAVKTVAKHFNKTVNVDTQKRKFQEFNGIKSPVRVDVKLPKAQTSTVVLGFAGPQNNSSKENVILELLMTSLLGYKTARMSSMLDILHTRASTMTERVGNRPTDPKAILIAAQTPTDNVECVIRTIYDVIDDVKAKPLSDEELKTAKKNLKMLFSRISENSQLMNSLLGNALLDNDLEYVENYISILDSITSQDVSDFAKKYLDLNKISISAVHPQNINEKVLMEHHSLAETWSKTVNKPIIDNNYKLSFKGKLTDKTPDVSKIKQYRLANNMEIALNPNKTELSSGIVSFKIKTPLNINPAVPSVLAIMLNEGTKTKDYKTFYNDIIKSGASLKFDADFQSIYASYDCLYEDTDMMLKSMKEVFDRPNFSDASLSYAKKLTKDSILGYDNRAFEFAFREMFPQLPEFATKDELLKSIDNITLQDVQVYFDYIKANSMAKGTFTAPFEKNSQLEKSIIDNLSVGVGNFKPYDVASYQTYQPLTEDKIIKYARPRNQADILQSFKFKTNYNPKDHAIFRLLNTILGDGPSSRLFNDLREKQKLAYHVDSDLNFVGDTGVISLGIQTTTDDKSAGVQQFDNVKKSLDGFKKHIEAMKTTLVSDEELNAAKLRTKTKLLNSIESSSSQTTVFSKAKDSVNGLESLNESLKNIDSITAQDIQNAAKYIFAGHSLISVVASEDTIKNMVV